MRFIGLDIHRDFCEVAIAEAGEVRLAGRVQTEPETLLPTITVESNRIRAAIAGFLVPYLHQHGLAPGVDPGEAGDFLARMVLSYIGSPGRWDLDDPAQVSELVRGELLAGVVVGPEPGKRPD